MNKIRLNLGDSEDPRVEILNSYGHSAEDGHPTLRDIAIILNTCIGQGGGWNLSREISTRTGFDIKEINEALWNIVDEYSKMTEQEAYEKWNTLATYINDGFRFEDRDDE